MSKWHDDKSKVKDVFDTLRNYGICGGIFYAGVHSLSAAQTSHASIIQTISGIAFIFLAVFLFYINTKIVNRLFREWAPDSWLGTVATLSVCALLTLLSVFMLTHSALQIQTSNGERIGDKTILDFVQGSTAAERAPVPQSPPATPN